MTEARKTVWNHSLTTVNEHCLNQVVELSKQKTVSASEDIYDVSGMKLIVKGTRVDEQVYERLIRFKLRKPLETSMAVEGGVSPADLYNLACELLDAHASLASVFTAGGTRTAVDLIKQLKLDGSSTLLLSIQQKESHKLRHSLLVALQALGIANQLHMSPDDLNTLLAAAVLHDVGELYIDPSLLEPGRKLVPGEWRQVASHPLIGGMVVQETTGFPRSVGSAIAEHHERASGFGYPRGLMGASISAVGSVLLTSETIAGIIGESGVDPLRIAHALKLIAGEFPAPIVAEIANTHAVLREQFGESEAFSLPDDLFSRADRIAAAVGNAIELVDTHTARPPAIQEIADSALQRLHMLRMALHSTGICELGMEAAFDLSMSLDTTLELDTVVRELEQQMTDLVRMVWLRAGKEHGPAWAFAEAFAETLEPPPVH